MSVRPNIICGQEQELEETNTKKRINAKYSLHFMVTVSLMTAVITLKTFLNNMERRAVSPQKPNIFLRLLYPYLASRLLASSDRVHWPS